jgi:uncharacterized cupredoxin-like copper-binding protein
MPRARALALACLAVPVAACGAESGTAQPARSVSASAPATTVAHPAHRRIVVGAREFTFAPHAIAAKAGKLKITLRNRGRMMHELILLKTNRAPGALRVRHGRVNEAASVGEISETQPAKSATHTFTLKPGHYVMVCNVHGHYQQGMRGALTVK